MSDNNTFPRDLQPVLKESYNAFLTLIRFIRTNYMMDEFWNGSTKLKFRRSNKTLTDITIKDGSFSALIIFGKIERAKFNEVRINFSPYICGYCDGKVWHDGQWMFIEVNDDTYINEIIELLKIKKKPNRKKENTLKSEFDPDMYNLGITAEDMTKL